MGSLALRDLQESFFGAVAGPEGVPEAAAICEAICPSGRLDAAARLAIYRGMYWARLVDVLREDYASILEALGPARFDDIARLYLAQTPSVHPSIAHVSDRFPEFLAGAVPDRPDLAEQAEVERARLEVFSEKDPNPLSRDRLERLAPEAWGAIPLRPIAALRVLTRAWAGPGRPRAHAVRVWRRGFEIFEAAMDALEARALDLVRAAPLRLEDLAGALAVDRSDDDAARETGALLLRWLEDGVLEDT